MVSTVAVPATLPPSILWDGLWPRKRDPPQPCFRRRRHLHRGMGQRIATADCLASLLRCSFLQSWLWGHLVYY